MTAKKIIRLIFKIVTAPLVLFGFLVFTAINELINFFEWLFIDDYDGSSEQKFSKMFKRDRNEKFKKWFTMI